MTDEEKNLIKEELKQEILREISETDYQSTINAKTMKEARDYFLNKMSKREHDDFRHNGKYRNAVSAFANAYMAMRSKNEYGKRTRIHSTEDSELYLYAYKQITDAIAKLFYD